VTRTRPLIALALPFALLAGCAAAPATTGSPTPDAPAAPTFTAVPDRDLVTIHDEPFDDNSGGWLDPGDEGNVMADGEFVYEGLAGFSTRWIGDAPSELMPLDEVQASVEFRAENLAEVGMYCRLDSGFTNFYRFVATEKGVRITKGLPDSDVPVELFRAGTPVFDPDSSGTLALACFEEPDGYHVEAFLDGELIAQAIDSDPPPAGGYVRVAWANQLPGTEGPYVFRMSSFRLETRA
jgi:hypothetical protein